MPLIDYKKEYLLIKKRYCDYKKYFLKMIKFGGMYDNTGTMRGRCTKCDCKEFIKIDVNNNCKNCNHLSDDHESCKCEKIVSDADINRIKDIYIDYMKMNFKNTENDATYRYLRNALNNPANKLEYLNFDSIANVASSYHNSHSKYIVMRPYNGEKTLIIGCGNKPVDYNYYGNHDHDHDGAYTVDPNLLMNPSIIGDMCIPDTFKSIPDKSFDKIVFEGLFILQCQELYEQIDRVKKDDAIIEGLCTDKDAQRDEHGSWVGPFYDYEECKKKYGSKK